MKYFFWALFFLAVLVVILGAWRFFTLRSQGAAVAVRKMPAEGVHGWRHGILRYNMNSLEYYKLSSLSPRANLVFHRLSLSIVNHRNPTDTEASFMSPGDRILTVAAENTQYELAVDLRGEMALTAWLESAPDSRQQSSLSPQMFSKLIRRRQSRK